MKLYFSIGLICCLFILGSCKKDRACVPVNASEEDAAIIDYNRANNVGAVKSSNNIYYNIIDSGSGIKPGINSKITVAYIGRLLNNNVFDSVSAPKTFALSDVIEGWQLCLPLLKKGGRMSLIIPSVYAYGCNGNSNLHVPANAVLVFNVQLVDVSY